MFYYTLHYKHLNTCDYDIKIISLHDIQVDPGNEVLPFP